MTTGGTVARGRLVSALNLEGDVTVANPDHVLMWSGEAPCDIDGQPLRLGGGPDHKVLAEDLVVDRTFSSKPKGGYRDYYAKLSGYASSISGPAAMVEPGATPMTYNYVETPADDSPFEYVDSSATGGRAR